MDESALKELIASLGVQLSALGWWMDFWTALVIIGCAGELYFVIHAYREDRRVWFQARTRGAIAFPEKPSLWVLFFEVLSVAAVVIGIAGELRVDWKSGDLQTRLRTANSSLVLLMEQKAGNAADAAVRANSAAGNAVNDASDAKTLAAGARKEAASFEADIKSAKKEAADAVSHLAEARERAAAAQAKALELEGKLADRSLTDAQLSTISRKLVRFAGQEYEVTAYWESPESLNIANRIHTALLNGAKWKYNPDGGKSQMLGGQIGVQIWNHPDADESTKRAAAALIEALNSEGIAAVARQQNPNNPKTNIINMNVGSKR